MKFYHYLLPGSKWGAKLDWDNDHSIAMTACDWPFTPNPSDFIQAGQAESDGQDWYEAARLWCELYHDGKLADAKTLKDEAMRARYSTFCIWDDQATTWTAYRKCTNGTWEELHESDGEGIEDSYPTDGPPEMQRADATISDLHYRNTWILACKDEEINGGDIEQLQEKYLAMNEAECIAMVSDLGLTDEEIEGYCQDIK